MPYTTYSLVHFALAGLCAFMAIVHGAMWIVDRKDTIQGWISASYVGFALLDLSLGGWSVGAGGRFGHPTVFFLFNLVAMSTSWPIVEVVWRLFPKDGARWRAVTMRPMQAVIVLRVVERVWALARTGTPATWELGYRTLSIVSVLTWSMFMFVGVAWVALSYQAVRRGDRFAWVPLLSGLPASSVIALDLWHMIVPATGVDSPALLGFCGLPFLLFASIHVVREFASAKRSAREGGDAGRYSIVRRIATGGMGELFLASRTGPAGFERNVVMKKILARGDAEAIERFQSEARLAAALQHPNIVSVFDMGRLEDGWFLVMEYIPGVSCSQIRDRARRLGEPVPFELVALVGEQICRGLDHAHAAGIIHRDVSPANVMATFDGEIKIVDFGIAKESGTPREGEKMIGAAEATANLGPAGSRKSSDDLTLAGRVLGRIAYLAPERFEGAVATPAADQYALGVTLYELLAGERPFDPAPALSAGVDPWLRGAPSLAAVRPGVPDSLAAAIERSLSRDPAARFSTAREMASVLRQCLARLPELDLGAWLLERFDEDSAGEMVTVSKPAEPTAKLLGPR